MLVYCKACKKIEDTDKEINLFSCSTVEIDGVAYPACYLHPAKDVTFPAKEYFVIWNP